MYNILELRRKTQEELLRIAQELGVKKASNLASDQLIYAILDQQAIVTSVDKKIDNKEKKQRTRITKKVVTEEDAIKGITAMQNYARAAIKNCKVLRTSPIEARFLHKDENELVRLYGVRYEDGGIWFMEDSSGHDFEPDAGKEYQQLFGEKLVNDTTVEVIRTGRWRFFCIDENPPEIKENIYTSAKTLGNRL